MDLNRMAFRDFSPWLPGCLPLLPADRAPGFHPGPGILEMDRDLSGAPKGCPRRCTSGLETENGIREVPLAVCIYASEPYGQGP